MPAFPLPRSTWPDNTATDIVKYASAGTPFKHRLDADELDGRREFARMAEALVRLGRGTTVVKNGVAETHPTRPQAYLDAIAMGEPPDIRNGLLFDVIKKDDQGNDVNTSSASSCGMFVRNLYKLIGVDIPSYKLPYVPGTVIHEEQVFAETKRALVHPGDVFHVGARKGKLRVPITGDAIYVTKGSGATFAQHFFVVLTTFNLELERHGPDGVSREAHLLSYDVAQGGDQRTDEFPDDGGDTATTRGHVNIDTDDWMVGDHKVAFWIDLATLVELGCDDESYITPVRDPDQ